MLGLILPFAVRRVILNLCGHNIHRESRLGLSIVLVDRLELDKHARIGHLNFISDLKLLKLDENALIGNLNWISGRMASADKNAQRSLFLHAGAAITNRHYIDCNGTITLHRFCTFAGVRSQMFTHSINMREGIQTIRNIDIGEYSFVGTGVIILPGAIVPNQSVIAAGSVVRPGLPFGISGIYAGNPAIIEKAIDAGEFKYMTRQESKVAL